MSKQVEHALSVCVVTIHELPFSFYHFTLFHFISETDMNTFWGKMSTIILDSELATDIKHPPAVPGLTQFLQSITRLFTSMCSEPRFANRNLLTKSNTMNPCLSVEYLLHSDFSEVRLLVLETILLWLNQVNAKDVMEEKGNLLLNLLSGLEETLIKMAVKEKHPECFCKVIPYFFLFFLRASQLHIIK